jgi:preprotein translocase subunit SecA
MAARLQQQMLASGGGAPVNALGNDAPPAVAGTVHHEGPKIGRNDPCPCGSGKKYKHCHGQLA